MKMNRGCPLSFMTRIMRDAPKSMKYSIPDMEDTVQLVANKNGRALLLFSKCHGKFNSQQKFTDEMLVELRTFNALVQQ